MVTVETERLLVRRPIEADRARFVELFVDPEFMVFGKGALTIAEAERRFNHMPWSCFALSPVCCSPISHTFIPFDDVV